MGSKLQLQKALEALLVEHGKWRRYVILTQWQKAALAGQALAYYIDYKVMSNFAKIGQLPTPAQARERALEQLADFAKRFQEVIEMRWRDDDIATIEDLAGACAKEMLWDCPAFGILGGDLYLPQVCDHLLCLLKPVSADGLLPTQPGTCRIWEPFVAADTTQVCIMVAYIQCLGLSDKQVLVVTLHSLFQELYESLRQASAHMSIQALPTPELHTMVTEFLTQLSSLCQDNVRRITQRRPRPCKWFEAHSEYHELRDCWSRISAQASEIASEVAKLPPIADAPDVPETQDSWSLVSASCRDVEIASLASHQSNHSQTSCLSAYGGPHCFLSAYLFKHFQPAESSSVVLVSAKDLQKGSKLLAADGTPIEVLKVEVQKTKKLLDLEITDALPFTTTLNHRIMVPSDDDDDTTVKAIDLKVGSWVMCSDHMAKKVIGKREYLVEEQDVLAITFLPDKAVACFLPPEQPVLLTKGLTPKPIRRGGMTGRAANQEVGSIHTEGDYRD